MPIPDFVTFRTLRRAAMCIVAGAVMLACAGSLVSSAASSAASSTVSSAGSVPQAVGR